MEGDIKCFWLYVVMFYCKMEEDEQNKTNIDFWLEND